MSTEVVT